MINITLVVIFRVFEKSLLVSSVLKYHFLWSFELKYFNDQLSCKRGGCHHQTERLSYSYSCISVADSDILLSEKPTENKMRNQNTCSIDKYMY